MAFNVAQFKHEGLPGGGARPSLFQVLPAQAINSAESFNTNALNKIPMVARSASLPASLMGVINVPYMGRTIKVAGNREFEDWVVTFMNDTDFLVREMFESWSNDINSLESNVRQPQLTMENYKADFNVRQFGVAGTILRSYKLVGAWPTRVTAIELDWDAMNQIEVFQVAFAYDYWLPDEGDAPAAIPYESVAITPASI